jgi:anti-sigma B factor antagonist
MMRSAWPKVAIVMPETDPHGLTIHDAGGGVLVLVGEIDAATAPELRRHLDDDPRVTVLDMRDVSFMDSSGLKVVLFANRGRAPADRITLRDPSARVRRVLQVAGLTDSLGTAANPSDAPE